MGPAGKRRGQLLTNVYLKFVSGAGNPPFVSLHYFSFPAA